MRAVIKSMNTSNATGLDGIKVGWLKKFTHTVTPFLRHIVNRTIVAKFMKFGRKWQKIGVPPFFHLKTSVS